ncbi:LPS export ABC transporter periplasmic protein LptC [Parvibaculum sp.]|jgi:lipopolysaccharide export system protein LptC|uniref:LPS export ABC transporter periplasmic protein LptC n=1 Tax=Parvibaculum sp. TaxID=2024848 RepID=UPI000C6512CF|nr:LPS export ABC transporter periplasmic protein LptC [Parvibaculum sp.]MAM95167.1 LPS export ABC transporter periplasmic protein LptC [Parvibaculum sp.]|tara:strand:+ start:25461 stop:26186 length:726 start_codon:yes stop_codon:yes gene_type:complete
MSERSGEDRPGKDRPGAGAIRKRPSRAAGAQSYRGRTERREGRYSRFVALMKIALPLGAFVLLTVILFYSGVFSGKDSLDTAFREIDTQPGDLRMVSPHVAGLTGDGAPYVITADNATQDPSQPNFVTFDNIQADVQADSEENWLSLTASRGRYNSETQILDLTQKIDIFTTWGYEMHSNEATVDFERGTLLSETEVQGHGPLGTLRADRMSADHATQVLRFDGDVKMLILPDRPSQGEQE